MSVLKAVGIIAGTAVAMVVSGTIGGTLGYKKALKQNALTTKECADLWSNVNTAAANGNDDAIAIIAELTQKGAQ